MDKNVITLLKKQAIIDGHWVGEPRMPVTNKATGDVIARVPDLGAAETNAAIEAAHRAFPAWSKLLAKERSKILRRWFDLIIEHADELALLLTNEQGKPLAEAKGEILYGAGFVEFFAEEAKRVYGETIPTHKADARIVVIKQPVGVVAAITPWNFPAAMITRKVGAGAGGRLHHGGQAGRGHAAVRAGAGRAGASAPACPRACSTSSPARTRCRRHAS